MEQPAWLRNIPGNEYSFPWTEPSFQGMFAREWFLSYTLSLFVMKRYEMVDEIGGEEGSKPRYTIIGNSENIELSERQYNFFTRGPASLSYMFNVFRTDFDGRQNFEEHFEEVVDALTKLEIVVSTENVADQDVWKDTHSCKHHPGFNVHMFWSQIMNNTPLVLSILEMEIGLLGVYFFNRCKVLEYFSDKKNNIPVVDNEWDCLFRDTGGVPAGTPQSPFQNEKSWLNGFWSHHLWSQLDNLIDTTAENVQTNLSFWLQSYQSNRESNHRLKSKAVSDYMAPFIVGSNHYSLRRCNTIFHMWKILKREASDAWSGQNPNDTPTFCVFTEMKSRFANVVARMDELPEATLDAIKSDQNDYQEMSNSIKWRTHSGNASSHDSRPLGWYKGYRGQDLWKSDVQARLYLSQHAYNWHIYRNSKNEMRGVKLPLCLNREDKGLKCVKLATNDELCLDFDTAIIAPQWSNNTWENIDNMNNALLQRYDNYQRQKSFPEEHMDGAKPMFRRLKERSDFFPAQVVLKNINKGLVSMLDSDALDKDAIKSSLGRLQTSKQKQGYTHLTHAQRSFGKLLYFPPCEQQRIFNLSVYKCLEIKLNTMTEDQFLQSFVTLCREYSIWWSTWLNKILDQEVHDIRTNTTLVNAEKEAASKAAKSFQMVGRFFQIFQSLDAAVGGAADKNTAAGGASAEGAADESAAAEGAADESTADEGAAGESTADEGAAGESTADKGAAGENIADESTAGENTADASTAGENTADESTADEGAVAEESRGKTCPISFFAEDPRVCNVGPKYGAMLPIRNVVMTHGPLL
jgi:hypothetical protein